MHGAQSLGGRFPVIDALQSSNWNRKQFEQLVEAGVDAVHVTLAYWEDCRQTLQHIGRWNRWLKDHGDLILLVRTAADIAKAFQSKRTGIIFGFQNCSPIEDDLSLVEIYYELGVRIMQITYNNYSLLGAGCYESNDAGVTKFGRNVIREMNRLGMIIDLSHTSERTSLETISISERPVAITHANPLSFHSSVRNKSDEVLKLLADNGGMLGFSLYPLHLNNGSNCTLESFCQMVVDTSEMIGIDHIGIGSDLCLDWGSDKLEYMRSGRWTFEPDPGESKSPKSGWPDYPSWYQDSRDLFNVAQGLESAGFSDDEVGKILGRNWFHFFEQGFVSS